MGEGIMLNNFRLVYPPDYDMGREEKMKNYDFIKALQIDTLVILIKESYLGFRNLSLEEYFTTDTKVLKTFIRSTSFTAASTVLLRWIEKSSICSFTPRRCIG